MGDPAHEEKDLKTMLALAKQAFVDIRGMTFKQVTTKVGADKTVSMTQGHYDYLQRLPMDAMIVATTASKALAEELEKRWEAREKELEHRIKVLEARAGMR